MKDHLKYADTETLIPSKHWAEAADKERLTLVLDRVKSIPRFMDLLQILSTKADGQIIVRLLKPIAAGERGTLLFDLEEFLKSSVDPGLVVWVEPLGDKSSLRNLRGIKVKS
jgi:hypothetical protein